MKPPSMAPAPGLTLARRVGEALYIGRDIMVTVTELRSGQVKLRVSAPPEVAVSRAEFTRESHLQRCSDRGGAA